MEVGWCWIINKVRVDLNILGRLLASEPHLVLVLLLAEAGPDEDVIDLTRVDAAWESDCLLRSVDDVDDVLHRDGETAGALAGRAEHSSIISLVVTD